MGNAFSITTPDGTKAIGADPFEYGSTLQILDVNDNTIPQIYVAGKNTEFNEIHEIESYSEAVMIILVYNQTITALSTNNTNFDDNVIITNYMEFAQESANATDEEKVRTSTPFKFLIVSSDNGAKQIVLESNPIFGLVRDGSDVKIDELSKYPTTASQWKFALRCKHDEYYTSDGICVKCKQTQNGQCSNPCPVCTSDQACALIDNIFECVNPNSLGNSYLKTCHHPMDNGGAHVVFPDVSNVAPDAICFHQNAPNNNNHNSVKPLEIISKQNSSKGVTGSKENVVKSNEISVPNADLKEPTEVDSTASAMLWVFIVIVVIILFGGLLFVASSPSSPSQRTR